MTTEMTDKMREEFEAWAVEESFNRERLGGGPYLTPVTEAAWQAWKASRAAAPAVQGELVGWQFYKHGKWWNGDILTRDQRKNIEKEGVRVRNVYAEPQLVEQQPAPDVTALVEALELAGLALHEIDECHIALVDIVNAIAAYRKQGGGE